MADLRIAVVGAGSIANRCHLPSLVRLRNDLPGLQFAAICDLDAARAERAARRFGFERTHGDYRAMLDAEDPDAVWVLVPYPATREVAGYMLSRGVPTLMEKPPGKDGGEARELAQIAAESATPHQVGLNRRFAPLIRRMRDLVAEAGGATATSCQFYRVGRTEPYFPYGTGLHGLDTLRVLGPSEVRAVHTCPGPRGSAVITYEYEDGALGVVEMLPQVGVQSERYTVHAGSRTVVVDGVVGWLTLYPGFLQCFDDGQLGHVEQTPADSPAEVVSGFYGESAAFIEALREGRAPSPGLGEALRSVQIAEAVQQGRSVAWPAA